MIVIDCSKLVHLIQKMAPLTVGIKTLMEYIGRNNGFDMSTSTDFS